MMREFNITEALRKLPGEIEDMIVRGAYLERSAIELNRLREATLVRLQTVRESQPPFMFLRPKDTRVAFKEATEGTTTDLSVIERAIFLNEQLQEFLRTRSETMLDAWLLDNCVEYRAGMASGHFTSDWDRALQRFTEQGENFMRTLGSARNMTTSGYDRVKLAYSPSAYEAMALAHTAAERIEAEIDAINAIAEDHDQMLGHTVFKDPMPRLVREPYAEVVAQIASHAPGVAQMEFDRVIAACDDLIHRELGMLRDRVHNGVHSHSARTKSYVHEAWMQLHGHALAHSVDMAYLEEVVTSTERAFAAEVATNGGARTNVAVTA